MKKYFKFSLLSLVLFMGMTSCEDATDIDQPSELPEDRAYTTVGDLRSGLIGVYAAYSPDAGGNGDGDAILFNDLFTDNIKRGLQSTGQGNQEYSFILQPNSGPAISIWGNRYLTINFANRVLRAWDRIVPTLDPLDDADQIAQANDIRAHLLALRALCHFDIASYYTPRKADGSHDPSAPSAIIMDFVPEIDQTFPRNTAAEVFAFIKNDLDQASDLILPQGTEANSVAGRTLAEPKYYMREAAINAIRARVALFEGDYATAQTLAHDLVEDHPLATKTEYESMFLEDAIVEENIFSLSRRRGDNTIVTVYYANDASLTGSPFFEASNQLFNLYAANDVRRGVNFIDPETVEINDPENVILIGKYRGGAEDALTNDVKLIRSSEMKLIEAECAARLGNLDLAEELVEDIRDIRIGNSSPRPNYASLNAALTDILLERRKELAFEGHRYLDLRRLGTELGVGISRNELDCGSFSAPCDLPAGDYRFTLPIPNTEVSANPTIVQNPNY